MKVLVAVKEVAVVGDTFDIDGLSIPEDYLEYELNEWDEYALETAVQLGEAGDADEVVTVTIGPDRSEETIRKALAKGADRAIRIWDESLEERDFLDSRAKAALLGGVVEDESPDLVLTGVQTDDDMFGATGVAVAELADYAWAAVVNDLQVQDEGLAVRRELEGGLEEISTVSLPAVCTIQTGINEPRYASLRGIRMAQRTEIGTRNLADLGLDSEQLPSGVEMIEMEPPVAESTAEIYEGTPTETAGALAEFLKENGVGSA